MSLSAGRGPGRAAAAAALAPVLATLAVAAPAPAAVGPHSNPGLVRPWSPQNCDQTRQVTLSQALATAANFNVVVADPMTYKAYLAQMHAVNPALQVFAYQKGVFTYNTTLAESAYAHDVLGLRVAGVQFPGTYLLDPSSPIAQSYVVGSAQAALTSSGYDGVYLDTLGPASLSPTFVSSLPVDPATGAVWTMGNWLSATAGLAGKVVAAVGAPVVGNGLRDGPNYFKPGASTSVLLTTGMAGAMAEAWLRGAQAPVTAYPSEPAWQQNVDALADAGARGASFFAVTKVWTTATQQQEDAWYVFTVASFLLGNDGHGYLSFSYTMGDATVPSSLYGLNLGPPIGAYAKISGVYQRRFWHGLVLVNPTPATVTLALGATYRTLGGSQVTSVTLAPDTAVILTLDATMIG